MVIQIIGGFLLQVNLDPQQATVCFQKIQYKRIFTECENQHEALYVKMFQWIFV